MAGSEIWDDLKKAIESIELPGFEKFGEGERHGSYEYTWVEMSQALMRFITVAITPAPLESPALYGAEVWTGADNRERYARYLVAQFDVVGPQAIEQVKEQLEKAISVAKVRANALQLGDLTNIHTTTPKSAKPDKIASVGDKPSAAS